MASLDDIFTTAKNIVTALNNASQIYLNVNGLQTISGITSATVVKASAGRVASVSVIVAGAVGKIYDATGSTSTSNPIYVIPATVGVVFVNLPVSTGIVVAPGSGQTVSVSFS
jgi:hypothetical protein